MLGLRILRGVVAVATVIAWLFVAEACNVFLKTGDITPLLLRAAIAIVLLGVEIALRRAVNRRYEAAGRPAPLAFWSL